jgi:hypothetical protein
MSWLEFSAPVLVALAVPLAALPPAGLLKKFWWLIGTTNKPLDT